MAAEEHLSPGQFGFKEGSHDDWMTAQSNYTRNPVKGRINIATTELHTGQPGIFPDRVKEYVDRPGMSSHTSQYLPAEVYHHDGKLWMGEGHHRYAAARARGQKTMRVDIHPDRGQSNG